MKSLIFRILGIGGKPIYKSVQRSPQAINQIRKKYPNAELVQKPSQTIMAAAKPFKPISGAGSRTVPSSAQRAERAAQASRMPKPKPATGGTGRPPAVRSGPPQRSGARKDIVVAKPRQVTTPSPRPARPPAKTTTGARPTRPAAVRRNLNPAMRAAIASMVAGKSAPTGTPPAKAAPTITTKPVPVPKAKPAEMKSPAPRERTKVKKRTSFTSGENTGFGPKGNIFPGSPEERKALMVMYGGTGSKAGKAAIAGTQGNIAKGQSLLDAAKNKKRSNVGVSSRANPALKKGGKVSAPKKTEVVARQMRGWGKARKPKR